MYDIINEMKYKLMTKINKDRKTLKENYEKNNKITTVI